MNYKKLIANTILQFSIIFIIINLFYFEKLDKNKIRFIFTLDAFYILILLIFVNLYISILFSFILKILSENKDYYKIIKIYLLGGLVNQAIPGLGYLYRYQKYGEQLKISVVKYGLSQSLNNIFILFSYLFIAISFIAFELITFEIKLDNKLNFFVIIAILLFLFFVLIYKHRRNLLNFVKLNRLYNELSNIKKKIITNKFKFLILFFFYIFHSYFQCYVFHKIVLLFEFEISFINTSYLYISSILSTFLSFTNFTGAFELVLSLTSSFVTDRYLDMWSVGLGFRIIGLVSITILIAAFYFFEMGKTIIKPYK